MLTGAEFYGPDGIYPFAGHECARAFALISTDVADCNADLEVHMLSLMLRRHMSRAGKPAASTRGQTSLMPHRAWEPWSWTTCGIGRQSSTTNTP